MARMDVRHEVNIPVVVNSSESEVRRFDITAKNLDLVGMTLQGSVPLAEDSFVKVKVKLLDEIVELKGRIARRENGSLYIKFVELDDQSRMHLWRFIRSKRISIDKCPICDGKVVPGQKICSECGMYVDVYRDAFIEEFEARKVSVLVGRLDKATEEFNRAMEDAELRLFRKEDELELLKELSSVIRKVCDVCRDLEEMVGLRSDFVRDRRRVFQERTDHFFSKSYFGSHARVWPKGYPGDYEILENTYRNIPLSSGIGYILDMYYLSTTLASAVRGRLATLRELLRLELDSRKEPRILDIACGSSRELFELAPEIGKSGARITCIDFDSEALNYSLGRLSYTNVVDQIDFRKYNALRMIRHSKNLSEFGSQDVIYSTGLFDYLGDDILVKMISALYELLNPGGKLIVSFKDCNRYRTQVYHWLVNWDSFLQRTGAEIHSVIEQAGIPQHSFSVVRESTGVIVFYVISK